MAAAQQILSDSKLVPHLIIDCSHANSGKDHARQPIVYKNVTEQRSSGNRGIVGVMLESHLNEGNQTLGSDPEELSYGVSITDSCVNWNDTVELIRKTYEEMSLHGL